MHFFALHSTIQPQISISHATTRHGHHYGGVHVDNVSKKRSIWRVFECLKLSTRLTRGHSHFLRQLTPTQRTKHLIHTCTIDHALACGNVDKIRFFIQGAFPLKKRVADFLIESRSAPLRIGKLLPARFPWWKCWKTREHSRHGPAVAHWSTIAGSHGRSVL